MPASAMAEPEPSVSTPQFAESEPSRPSPAFDPFEAQAAAPSAPLAQAEWTPPPSPQSSFQNQPGGTSMQSPPPAAGQNKTLAIVSLVLGLVSFLCCSYTFVPGLAAIITGFMARSKANSNPTQYGGSGLALGGIILGAISLLTGILVIALYFLGIFASVMTNTR